MSYTNFGRYPSGLLQAHSQARQSLREQTLNRRRTGTQVWVPSDVNLNSVNPSANTASLNLPVPKKRKKTVRVTKKTLLRDVQQIKNKISKKELKYIGIGFGESPLHTYTANTPTKSPMGSPLREETCFIAHPCHTDSGHAPLLPTGTENGTRIGDKVYFVTARYRLTFRLNTGPFLQHYQHHYTDIQNFPITGTPTTSAWTGTYTIPLNHSSNLSSDGIVFPIRVVSLAIREDYLKTLCGDNNRRYLALSDIFTSLDDYNGAGTVTSDYPSFLYSRKVKNAAAGKVRIKTDNVHYLSTGVTANDVIVIDKNIAIRQQYSFEAAKTDGWVHGLLVHIPNIIELKRYMHGEENINWSTFTPTKPVVMFQGSACFYYYDD